MPSITMELVKMSKEKKAQLVKEVTEANRYCTSGHFCLYKRK